MHERVKLYADRHQRWSLKFEISQGSTGHWRKTHASGPRLPTDHLSQVDSGSDSLIISQVLAYYLFSPWNLISLTNPPPVAFLSLALIHAALEHLLAERASHITFAMVPITLRVDSTSPVSLRLLPAVRMHSLSLHLVLLCNYIFPVLESSSNLNAHDVWFTA